MCFVKYHVSEDRSSIAESSGGVQTLRNVNAYHEPTWHFDGKFVDGQGHVRTNVQRAPGHGHGHGRRIIALLVDNKVNAIYTVGKLRRLESNKGLNARNMFSQ